MISGVLVVAKTYTVSRNALVPAFVEDEDDLVPANARLSRTATLAGAIAASAAVAVYAATSGVWSLRIGAAVYVLGAVSLYPRDRLIAVLIIAAIVIKVLMEQFSFYDFNTGSLIGARVVIDAHLYGLLMAIAIALLWSTYTMNARSREQSN